MYVFFCAFQGEPFWVGGHRRFAEDGIGIAGGGDDNGIAGGGGDDDGIAGGGGDDDGIAGGGDDNEWRWSDGSPLLTFKNWFPGLPDDSDIITGGPESCLMVSISFPFPFMSSFVPFRRTLKGQTGQIGSA
jgi:hypothetical protein